jgi:hypothetical protein
MVARSYRLDTVAAHLIERLEGARRSYIDRPAELDKAGRRIVDEALAEVLSEMEEVMSDPTHAERLGREMGETFLPRWLKLAKLQNELEATRFDTWRQGDIGFRMAAFFGPLLIAIAMTRVLHSPIVALGYVIPFMLPFLPELRAWQSANRYRIALQAIIDDLERIQLQLDAYQPALSFEEPGVASATKRDPGRQPDSH